MKRNTQTFLRNNMQVPTILLVLELKIIKLVVSCCCARIYDATHYPKDIDVINYAGPQTRLLAKCLIQYRESNNAPIDLEGENIQNNCINVQ